MNNWLLLKQSNILVLVKCIIKKLYTNLFTFLYYIKIGKVIKIKIAKIF